MNSMLFAIGRQVEVFSALMQREAEWRFARRSLGVVEEVASIVVHIGVVSFLRVISGAEEHDGMAILPFCATGVFTYWLFRTGLSNVSSAVFLIGRYSPYITITPLDVALARGMVNLLLYATIGFLTFYVLQLTGYSGEIRDPAYVIGMLFYAGIFGMGCGLVAAGMFYYAPILRTVIVVGGLRILSLISGTFFVIPDIPIHLREYALWIPLLHMNDMMREAYFQTYNAHQADRTYVFLWVLGSITIGLVAERALRHVSSTRLS